MGIFDLETRGADVGESINDQKGDRFIFKKIICSPFF